LLCNNLKARSAQYSDACKHEEQVSWPEEEEHAQPKLAQMQGEKGSWLAHS
jgi:hypothetical protein